jgi:hypothetical protein
MFRISCKILGFVGLLAGLLAAQLPAAAPSGSAGDVTTAHLKDGRVVSGQVDIRTDNRQLWLRRSGDGFDLVSAFAWNEVAGGTAAGQRLDDEQLRQWASAQKRRGRKFLELERDAQRPVVNASSAEKAQATGRRVKTLVIQAQLAQWDDDAQTDGLRVLVSPLDAHGQIVPVRGHIELTLEAQREQIGGKLTSAKSKRFLEGDRASFPVKPEDFAGGPAFYELPFSQWHPDFAPAIAPQALVFARLSVQGQGVFEASDAQVCLRELSRFRDQLQYHTPGRYLPIESGGQYWFSGRANR